MGEYGKPQDSQMFIEVKSGFIVCRDEAVTQLSILRVRSMKRESFYITQTGKMQHWDTVTSCGWHMVAYIQQPPEEIHLQLLSVCDWDSEECCSNL